MNTRHLPVALVAALALTPLVTSLASAAPPSLGQCVSALNAEGLKTPTANPSRANYVLGTASADDLSDRLTDGVDIVCGFGGDDFMRTLGPGDVFLGGDGADNLDYITVGEGATFVGGAGNDTMGDLPAGLFRGGDGADSLSSLRGSGTFDAGAGSDLVSVINGGTYDAGAGDDAVALQISGVYNGGDGDDVNQGLQEGGVFNGGAGLDSVVTLQAGIFNGGPGLDSVGTQTGGTFTQD